MNPLGMSQRQSSCCPGLVVEPRARTENWPLLLLTVPPALLNQKECLSGHAAYLPELGTDLVAALATLDVNNLPHVCCPVEAVQKSAV